MNLILSQKNILNIEIKQLEKCIENNKNTLSRMRKQIITEYLKFQINKLENENKTSENFIFTFQEKILNLDKGILDKELIKQDMDINILVKEKRITAGKKKSEEMNKKKELSKMSKNYYQSGREDQRNHRRKIKDSKRAYKYYLKVVYSLPSYMENNLKSMPNNKGYIWRGIFFFGKLPEESNKNMVLFEKKKGGILIIHEWSEKEYKIYHKNRNSKKQLYSTKKLKNKKI